MRAQRSARRGGTDARAGGFSLVEMMIAITVILVGLLSAYSSELSSLEVVETSRETNTASSDLQACMESILALPPLQIPSPSGPYAPDRPIEVFENLHLEDQRIIATYPNYTVGGPIPDPLQITLKQTWTDRKGRAREMQLSSSKTR